MIRSFDHFLGIPAVVSTTGVMLLPMRGLRARILEAKQAEIAHVDAAIQGDPSGLAGSSIRTRADGLSLADLLAYREFVRSVSEWPFDAPMRARYLLYVAIPLGSWLGGAFVERMLDVALN